MKPWVILLADNLTNDFLSPLPEFFESGVHVGKGEVARLLSLSAKPLGRSDRPMSEDPYCRGPLPAFLRSALAAMLSERSERPVALVFIRDLHNPLDPEQQAEMDRFGEHNVGGSRGAAFVPGVAEVAARARLLETDSLAIPSASWQSLLTDILGKNPLSLSREERAAVTFVVTGLYTEGRVSTTAFKLRNEYRFPRVLVCPHLVGSRFPDQQRRVLLSDMPNALVTVIPDLEALVRETGIALPDEILAAHPPCRVHLERKTPGETEAALPEEWEQIIRHLFCFCEEVRLLPLSGGFSGCGLFLTHSRRAGAREEPAVVKIGPHGLLYRELRGFHRVSELVGRAVPALGTPVRRGSSTGVRMELAAKEGIPRTLQWFAEEALRRPNEPTAVARFADLQGKILELLTKRLYGNTRHRDQVYPFREYGLANRRQVLWMKDNIGYILPGADLEAPELVLAPGLSIPNPLNSFPRLLQFPDRVWTDVGMTHGDLNYANQLFDGRDNPWILDWAFADEKPIVTDFAKLEADLRFVLHQSFTEDDVPALIETERLMDLGLDIPAVEDAPPQVRKALHTLPALRVIYEGVRRIRRAYRETVSDPDPFMYAVALLRFAVHTLKFDAGRGLGDCGPVQLRHALASVSCLIGRLVGDPVFVCDRRDRPHDYPERVLLPADRRPWEIPCHEYAPAFYEASTVVREALTNPSGWADPADWKAVPDLERRLGDAAGTMKRDESGRMLNPVGRTGLAGRGSLGRWGPNLAVDPVVVRRGPGNGRLEFLLIKRRDAGHWALPGTMIQPGEDTVSALERTLKARCCLPLPASAGTFLDPVVVHDFRNTDHAWIESRPWFLFWSGFDQALGFGCDEAPSEASANEGASLMVVDRAWRELSPDLAADLFANHLEIIRICLTTAPGVAHLPTDLVESALDDLP